MVMFALLSSLMLFADFSFAQTASNQACSGIVKFFSNIEGLLKLVSISVVTIAVIFAGYQIAFAHKRISDVAPILKQPVGCSDARSVIVPALLLV